MLTLQILGALAALAFGIWLGSAGEYRRNLDEIDQALGEDRPRRRARRHTTFLNAFFRRKAPPSARRRHRGRRSPFSSD